MYFVKYKLCNIHCSGLAYFGYFLPVWPHGLTHLATFYKDPVNTTGPCPVAW